MCSARAYFSRSGSGRRPLEGAVDHTLAGYLPPTVVGYKAPLLPFTFAARLQADRRRYCRHRRLLRTSTRDLHQVHARYTLLQAAKPHLYHFQRSCAHAAARQLVATSLHADCAPAAPVGIYLTLALAVISRNA